MVMLHMNFKIAITNSNVAQRKYIALLYDKVLS